MRIVRTPAGEIEVDPSGKANGRGAYLHDSRPCWDEALTKDKLSRALKTSISAAARSSLQEFAATVVSGGQE